MIPRHNIDQIINHARIEEVVGEFVHLKKRGNNHVGLCPFHDEKTPSFAVSSSKGIYKCFGCGKSGSVVNFIMDHEHFTYPEALRYLAKKYNIEIEEEEKEDTVPKEDRERMFAAVHYAAEFYRDKLLQSDEGKQYAQTYLKERGFKPAVTEQFQVGYSPDSWDSFLQSAREAGFEILILEKAGLISQAKNGNYIDRFRGRLMFPIYSMAGRAIGFGGRVLGDKEKEAKYINTQETEIYHKSQALFGLYHAKKAIVAANECIVVEGYTDVLAMHQQGFANVISVSGTSLTEEHVKKLHRLTSRLLFIFDSDDAGHKAADRAINLSLEQNLEVELVELPDGEDPASYVLAKDSEEVRSFFDANKQDFLTYKAAKIAEGSAGEKAGAISGIVGAIARVPDPVRRELHLKELSNKLGLELRTLFDELNNHLIRFARQKRRQNQPEAEEEKKNSGATVVEKPEALANLTSGKKIEKKLFGWLMLFGDRSLDEERSIASMLIEQLGKVNISDEVNQKIYNIYLENLEKGRVPSLQEFLHHEDNAVREIAANAAGETERETSPNWATKHDIIIPPLDENYIEEVKRTLNHFMIKKVNELVKENQEKLKNASGEEEQKEHLEVHNYLINMRKSFAETLGSTVIN